VLLFTRDIPSHVITIRSMSSDGFISRRLSHCRNILSVCRDWHSYCPQINVHSSS